MASPSVSNKTKTNTNSNKMYYKLTNLSPAAIHQEISNLTDNFNSDLHLSPEFVTSLQQDLNSNTNQLFRGFLNTPKNDDGTIMKQVIGKEGCYFHMTTQNTKSMFIWHDRDNYKVYIWGEKFPVINSLKIIQQRIKNISQKHVNISESK